MPDRGLESHRGERAHAADTEHGLLLEPRVPIAAVEPVRDVAVGGAIRGDVGVEQEERYVSDAGLPDLDLHLAPRELECDLQLASVLAAPARWAGPRSRNPCTRRAACLRRQ